MNNFWRVSPLCINGDMAFNAEANTQLPAEFINKIKPRHGIVLAEWNEQKELGKVKAFGIVKSIDISDSSANIVWSESDVVFRPNPSGKTHWRKKPFFKFAKDVSIRYMLDDLFAEHFPDIDDIQYGNVKGGIRQQSTERIYQEIHGYIYVIKSQFGYKIGKTVNLKSRTNLFAVKLPFPIEIFHYAWFENYSKAEREFHEKYADKRLEGEWFDLSEDDLQEIKKHGKKIPVDGL